MKTLLLLVFVVIAISKIQAQEAKYEDFKAYIRIKENADPQDFIIDLKKQFGEKYTSAELPFNKLKHNCEAGRNLARTVLVETNTLSEIDEILTYCKSRNDVEFIERIPLVEMLFHPDDSLYVNSIMGANPKWLFDLIGAEQAWDYQTGNPDIKVAIIDNAVWTAHPDLQGKFYDEWDFADNDNSAIPATSANTANGRQWSHGTHVAGLVGAITNNNRGVASIGFNISLIAYKMYTLQLGLPWPNLTAGIQAITHAVDTGANVINISWGTTNQMQTLLDATNYAYSNNVVVVAAAGNNGQEEQYYPAAQEHVIAIASVGMDDKLSSFSNFGTFVDLTSPGGYGPNDLGTWSPVSTTYHDAYAWASIIGAVKYDGKVGTSMATPVVSGLCGLILSADSTFTPDEVENILKITSTDISALNPSYNGKIGTGRIHAGHALEYIYNQVLVDRKENNSELLIYPDPCTEVVNISFKEGDEKEWRIINVSGKVSMTGRTNDNSTSVNVSSLPDGIYFFQATCGNKRLVKKFIKNSN